VIKKELENIPEQCDNDNHADDKKLKKQSIVDTDQKDNEQKITEEKTIEKNITKTKDNDDNNNNNNNEAIHYYNIEKTLEPSWLSQLNRELEQEYFKELKNV